MKLKQKNLDTSLLGMAVRMVTPSTSLFFSFGLPDSVSPSLVIIASIRLVTELENLWERGVCALPSIRSPKVSVEGLEPQTLSDIIFLFFGYLDTNLVSKQ